MRVKVLRYAEGRDDKIVPAYEDVTFENEHAGWYVDCSEEGGCQAWDNIAIVERIGTVCFVADFVFRNALNPGLFAAIAEEARHLQGTIQHRIDFGCWIPLAYVAAYEALGWDARPLINHREQIRRERMKKEEERRKKMAEAAQARRREEERQLEEALKESERRFVRGKEIDPEMLIRLCQREHIVIHPRTLHTLRHRIDWLSKTQVAFKYYNKGNRLPQGVGCFAVIRKLSAALNRKINARTVVAS